MYCTIMLAHTPERGEIGGEGEIGEGEGCEAVRMR